MSLDWFAGQKCALKARPELVDYLVMRLLRVPAPQIDKVYTVSGAMACSSCGCHIALRELGGEYFYPSYWFRPLEFREMDVLRGLLAPKLLVPESLTL